MSFHYNPGIMDFKSPVILSMADFASPELGKPLDRFSIVDFASSKLALFT